LAFVRRICSAREFLTSVRSARDNSARCRFPQQSPHALYPPTLQVGRHLPRLQV
jgi:hypothetical protein